MKSTNKYIVFPYISIKEHKDLYSEVIFTHFLSLMVVVVAL